MSCNVLPSKYLKGKRDFDSSLFGLKIMVKSIFYSSILYMYTLCVFLWSTLVPSLFALESAVKNKAWNQNKGWNWERQLVKLSSMVTFSPTLTALLLSELSSSVCRPVELGGLPREFWRSRVGGVPWPRRSQSCLASALQGKWEVAECLGQLQSY